MSPNVNSEQSGTDAVAAILNAIVLFSFVVFALVGALVGGLTANHHGPLGSVGAGLGLFLGLSGVMLLMRRVASRDLAR